MTTQETYERYVVSKVHDYTQSHMFPSEFYIYLPKWESEGIDRWRRCRNTDLPEQWDMKPFNVEAYSRFGLGFDDIYTLYILGYIPLSLHKLRMQDKIDRLTPNCNRWWCTLECRRRAWCWRPLWGKLTQYRARVMEELCSNKLKKLQG